MAGITPGWAYLPDLPQGHACWGLPAGLTAEAALGALLRECRPRTRLAVLPGGSYGNLSATSTRWVRLLACGLFLSLPCRRMVFPWVAFRLEARVCSAQRPCRWMRPGSPTSAAAVPPWKYVLTARPDCIAVGWRGGRPQAACPGKGYL